MRRGRLFILIALLLLLSAAGIFMAFMLSGGAGILTPPGPDTGGTGTDETAIPVTATPEPVMFIIAAGQTLERGAPIPTEALISVPWPTAIVPPSAITDAAKIVDTRARYTIARGEPIFSTMIVESLLQLSPTGSDAAAQIPPGSVAISIPYDRNNGVANAVRDGDSVNVIVSWAIVELDQAFQSALPNLSHVLAPPNTDGLLPNPPSVVAAVNPGGSPIGNPVGRGEPVTGSGAGAAEDIYVIPAEGQRSRMVSQAVIQNVLVLHVGEFGEDKPTVVEPTATPDPAATPVEGAPAPTATAAPPDIITLVVSPQDALVLNYINRIAERYPGSVVTTLALRSAGDTSVVDTESVTLQYMFERFNVAVPAKLTYGPAGNTAPDRIIPTATPVP